MGGGGGVDKQAGVDGMEEKKQGQLVQKGEKAEVTAHSPQREETLFPCPLSGSLIPTQVHGWLWTGLVVRSTPQAFRKKSFR